MPAVCRRFGSFVLLALLVLAAPGCERAYYSTWEKLGWQKRDLLADNVEEARDSQQAAKEQFQTALERFSAVVKIESGELEAQYKKLRSELDRAESRAKAVHDKVAAVENVADDLFKEWEKELGQYQSPELRRSSEQQLRDTRDQYARLIAAMKRAESRMEPVLAVFRDQVLFLKHNLNARAIASMQGVAVELETDVNRLLQEMQASINEADAFLKTMK